MQYRANAAGSLQNGMQERRSRRGWFRERCPPLFPEARHEGTDMIAAFLACQLFVVLFIGLHDWIPLGRFNDIRGVHSADSPGKLVIVTLLSTLPFAIGLAGSAYYATSRFPMWLVWFLWISYGIGLYGLIRSWYLPYLFVPDPARAARYQPMFAGTHTFLPVRNGIAPNTLHVIFHAVYLATVVLLIALTYSRA
jgi:hypothetical protein